jgi:hypothetical protein
MDLALGHHGNCAMVVGLVGVMMQAGVQRRRGSKSLKEKKESQAKERNCSPDRGPLHE